MDLVVGSLLIAFPEISLNIAENHGGMQRAGILEG